jgi:hypothetical protein
MQKHSFFLASATTLILLQTQSLFTFNTMAGAFTTLRLSRQDSGAMN